MSEKVDETITSIYTALGNPHRRRIVDILKNRGKAGFKELHENLRISVGALYHHLEALEGLVTQGPDKKYVLTERGKSAIIALSTSEERITTSTARFATVTETTITLATKELFFGRSLFLYLNRQPLSSLPLSAFIVLLGGWLSSETGLEPLLLFYVNPSSGISKLWLIALFPLGWLANFALTEILSLGIYRRRGGELALLNGTAFSMLPLLIVPGVFFFLGLNPRTASFYVALLPILLQAWVICLLSASITVAKGLKMERTALISLAVVYVNILVLLLSSQLRLF